jgi:hypothetical protein
MVTFSLQMFPSTPIIGSQQVTVPKPAIMSRPSRYCFTASKSPEISEIILLPTLSTATNRYQIRTLTQQPSIALPHFSFTLEPHFSSTLGAVYP